jgi:XTP/dITP diphosphohydrolase
MKKKNALAQLLEVMARLRAPNGCPWDREQDHRSISLHAIEEVYELIDAIEAEDDVEMAEELGDLLLQVVFHCQLASERKAFDFETVAQRLVEKLIRRHPHVFGDSKVKTIDAIWTQWDQIKKTEKKGTIHERPSALDGVPRHLPSLMRAEKLLKKARKAGLNAAEKTTPPPFTPTKAQLGPSLLALVQYAQSKGWSTEDALRRELNKTESAWRKKETQTAKNDSRRSR